MRTRIADRANALVWRLPAPRRARVLLSQIVYRNPPICSSRVSEALRALDEAGVETVLIGGWGVDALVGKQLRSHADLDLIVNEHQLERAAAALGALGFAPWNHDSNPGPIGDLRVSSAQTLRDRALRVVELHAADLHALEPVEGTIDGETVACLSADLQLQAQHQMGRTWTPQRRAKRKRNLTAVRVALKSDGDGA